VSDRAGHAAPVGAETGAFAARGSAARRFESSADRDGVSGHAAPVGAETGALGARGSGAKPLERRADVVGTSGRTVRAAPAGAGTVAFAARGSEAQPLGRRFGDVTGRTAPARAETAAFGQALQTEHHVRADRTGGVAGPPDVGRQAGSASAAPVDWADMGQWRPGAEGLTGRGTPRGARRLDGLDPRPVPGDICVEGTAADLEREEARIARALLASSPDDADGHGLFATQPEEGAQTSEGLATGAGDDRSPRAGHTAGGADAKDEEGGSELRRHKEGRGGGPGGGVRRSTASQGTGDGTDRGMPRRVGGAPPGPTVTGGAEEKSSPGGEDRNGGGRSRTGRKEAFGEASAGRVPVGPGRLSSPGDEQRDAGIGATAVEGSGSGVGTLAVLRPRADHREEHDSWQSGFLFATQGGGLFDDTAPSPVGRGAGAGDGDAFGAPGVATEQTGREAPYGHGDAMPRAHELVRRTSLITAEELLRPIAIDEEEEFSFGDDLSGLGLSDEDEPGHLDSRRSDDGLRGEERGRDARIVRASPGAIPRGRRACAARCAR